MAQTIHNRFKAEGVRQTIDFLGGAGIKFMIADNVTVWTQDPDDDFVDLAGANDIIDAEYAGTGYTGGFGGGGRTVLASKTITQDDTNNRAELDAADKTFTAIGSGSESINFLFVIDETGAANDLASDVLCSLDSGLPVTTNGGDVTFQFDAEGIMQLT